MNLECESLVEKERREKTHLRPQFIGGELFVGLKSNCGQIYI